ncbi:putative tail fiber domain protein, partial [Acinetobacter baumannii 6112]
LIRAGYSWITIDNPSFIYGINNKYRHETYTGLIDIDNSDSVVTLRGGRIANINSGVFADAVRVNGGTFNYESPLWVGVGFPDDTSDFKIRVSNWAAILDLSSFTGRKYTFNGRGQKWDVHTKTKFLNGLQANQLGTTSLNNIRKDFYVGVQSNGNNGSVANGYPFDGFGGTVLNFSDADAAQYSNTAQLALSAVSNRVFYRRAAYEQALGTWYEFRTTANTTVDSNGFIKAASPIVKLFADKIELNDEAAEQNIIFEKLGVGDYLIKNSNGFSNDGWYIETPKDANGNVLVAVVYEQLS